MSDSDVLLAIESTCDETAAAVIRRDGEVLSSVVASQDELHERFGGVVPEIASRAHLERILPVMHSALQQADVSVGDLTAVAVATQPGLVGSLLVGLTAAKTIALTQNIPLVAIDHVQAHIYACRMHAARDVFPAVGLVVSGGHTNLYDCRTATESELIGSTVDDAAGEAFDKVAQILNLDWPGGPSIDRLARSGNRRAIRFPRAFFHDKRLDFSFSGLKTAVLYHVRGTPGKPARTDVPNEQEVADIAASFQDAVVDVLIRKSEQALDRTGHTTLCVGGGVAANSRFRERLENLADRLKCEVIVAPANYCTDNAAMGAIAWERLERGQVSPLDLDVTPGLVRLNKR